MSDYQYCDSRDDCDASREELSRALAEIERLRATLESIVVPNEDPPGFDAHGDSHAWWQCWAEEFERLAVTALERNA